jgi:phosphoribosylamine--glycine ligase
MGAVSPVPFFEDELKAKVISRIIEPTIKGLQDENISYIGFIFFGLINVAGEPYVIEYNCRMGDPETEVVFPRIESDVVEMFESIRSQTLKNYDLRLNPQFATTVVLVSGGYPGEFEKGKEIHFSEDIEDSIVFHSGTKNINSELITNGGRVFAITSFGNTILEAVNHSLQSAEKIEYKGKYYRTDIGKDLI